ncbi:MAG: SulP family inorganic anion transporter [Gammaproteobacteria bacterium]
MLARWKDYDRQRAGHDLGAAVIVVVMLVPQSLAYAQVAGMPLQTGLYASILPLIAYALFGTSSALSVGPVAVISLMTAATLSGLEATDTATYTMLAAWLAMLSGAMLFLAGFLRMGYVANLMSHPVVSGFMTGAAILIVLGQLKPLLGMRGEGETALELARALIAAAHTVQPPTAAVGLAALAALWWLPRAIRWTGRQLGMRTGVIDIARKLAPLLVVIVAILATGMFDLDDRYRVAVVGVIPAGIPGFGIAIPTLAQVKSLLLPAFVIGLIGFVESVSVAQSLALQRRERIDPNAELRGLGAANCAAAISGGFPVTGGLSRSIVNFSAGARTPLAGVFAALMMLGVVTWLTELFTRLPSAVLAAAIIVPVMGLIDTHVLKEAWGYSRGDAWAYLGTAGGVLVFGIELGILLGVALSLTTIVWQASMPHIAEIGRVPGTSHYRNVKRAAVETFPHLLALRIDADLFFANVRPVEQAIQAAISSRPGLEHLLLDLSAVNQIDLTGLEGLRELNRSLQGRGVRLHLAEVKGPVLDRLARSTFLQELAAPPFRFTHDAFVALNADG